MRETEIDVEMEIMIVELKHNCLKVAPKSVMQNCQMKNNAQYT